jgi:hypothetical protein
LPTGVFRKSAKGLAGPVKVSLHWRQFVEQDLTKHRGEATRLNELVNSVCELLFGCGFKVVSGCVAQLTGSRFSRVGQD